MCYIGCRYEYAYGSSRGECWLADDDEIPRDAMCRIDDLAIEHDRIKSENAKLRELAMRFADYVGQDRCEGCVTKTRCNEGLIDECWLLMEIREIADGLGIEVER